MRYITILALFGFLLLCAATGSHTAAIPAIPTVHPPDAETATVTRSHMPTTTETTKPTYTPRSGLPTITKTLTIAPYPAPVTDTAMAPIPYPDVGSPSDVGVTGLEAKSARDQTDIYTGIFVIFAIIAMSLASMRTIRISQKPKK